MEKKTRFNWLLIPVMIVVGVIPLLYRTMESRTFLENVPYVKGNAIMIDTSIRIKMWAVIVLLVLMVITIVCKLIVEGKRIKFVPIFLPLIAYMFLAVLSTFGSKYRDIAVEGMDGLGQPIWVILGYCVIAYYSYLVINEAGDLAVVMIALTVGTALMLVIGISELIGHDIMRTTPYMWLTYSSEWFAKRDATRYLFDEGRVVMTLFNPNYVGSYVSLLAPVFAMMALSSVKIWRRIVYGVIALGLILCLLGSESRAGFVGVIAAGFLYVILVNKKIINNWFAPALIVVLLIGSVITVNNYGNGALWNKVRSSFSGTVKTDRLTGIETLDNEVIITYMGNRLHVTIVRDPYSDGVFIYPCNDEYEPVDLIYDGAKEIITDERFKGFEIAPVIMKDENYLGFTVIIEGEHWNFCTNGKTFYHFTYSGRYYKMRNSETVEWLEEHSGFASGRGFIWARTLPLLKDHLVTGVGPDAFFFAFPNDDEVALYNANMRLSMITKPHNMYLQIGVETGLLSMLCVIIFYLMYFIPSVKLYIRLETFDCKVLIGVGILCGSFGYMVVQLINDSIVAVAPVYWALMGIGIAVNMMVLKDKELVSASKKA